MSAESTLDREWAAAGDSARFLGQLDEAAHDPRETLIAMQKTLGIDFGFRLDMEPRMVDDDPDTVRSLQLSLLQYEGIKSMEDLVRIYCEHGIFNPAQLGAWLQDQQPDLRYKRPIELLFSGLSETGFDQRDVLEVTRSAVLFLQPEGFQAVWDRWGD